MKWETLGKRLMESTVTTKGRITIPKSIRKYLGLKPGDRVKFLLHLDGTVVLLPKVPAAALRGMLRSRRRRPVSIEQMEKAIAAGASNGNQRRKRR